MTIKNLKNLKNMFIQSITGHNGKIDEKALTALISFIILVVTWFANLFFGFIVNDLIIEIFAFIVISLLGIKAVPWGKKNTIEPIIEETNNIIEEPPNEIK